MIRKSSIILLLLLCCRIMIFGQDNGTTELESYKDYLVLDSLALYHFELGNDSIAKSLCENSLVIKERIYGRKSSHYATSLSLLSEIELDLDNDSVALSYAKESQTIRKSVLGEKNVDYVNSLNVLAEIYFSMARYKEAQNSALNAYRICKKYVTRDNPEYARCINSLALSKYAQGCYNEAIFFGTESLKLREETQGRESADYLQSLGNLAAYNSYAGNYVEAIRLGTEEAQILKSKFGPNHLDYANCLNNLGFFNTKLGNYTEALRIYDEALHIRRIRLGTENPRYGKTLSNIAFCHSELGHKQQAVELGEEVVKLYKSIYGNNHSDCGMALMKLANFYCDIGNYEKALLLSKEAVDIYRNIYGNEHPEYALALGNMAKVLFFLGDSSEAYRLSENVLQIREKSLGLNHPDVAASLNSQSFYASCLKKYREAFKLEQRATDILSQHIKFNFSQMSSFRRKHYWDTHRNEFCDFLPSLVFKFQNPESISELYDKTALFAKGILLGTVIEMRELISNSADSLLLDDYKQLVSNKEYYNKLAEIQEYNETYLDSLKLAIQEQEDKIIAKSRIYGNYTHNLNISWRDIKKKLDENEIAIEFLDFPIGGDSVMYVALTIKKDYNYPHLIPLFELKQLKSIPERLYYTKPKLGELIWGPLKKELEFINKIYFSPSGQLHNIGIEYLPLNAKENIHDMFSFCRLSSTRQLVIATEDTNGKGYVIYGGINYNESDTTSVQTTEKNRSNYLKTRSFRKESMDSLELRNNFDYLEGTKKEADQIVCNLQERSIPYKYYYGKEGTEESFKFLSGTRPLLIHVATHGFYLSETDAVVSNFAKARAIIDSKAISHEDKPMTRSGLLFAGCNHALNHEQPFTKAEDGILTAQEISCLDLRGLELVVLSACQTGLGDITSGEGVFGLQRGFKMAGANTLIMSLWEVSDKATEILMTTFYDNYLSGMSKLDAFSKAREEVRRICSPRQTKPDWAAFVMLDGIN